MLRIALVLGALLMLACPTLATRGPVEPIDRPDAQMLVPFVSILEEGTLFDRVESRVAWLKLWRYRTKAAMPFDFRETATATWEIDYAASLEALRLQSWWYDSPPSMCPTFAPLRISCGGK